MRTARVFEIDTAPEEFEDRLGAYLSELAKPRYPLNRGVTLYLDKPEIAKLYRQDQGSIYVTVTVNGCDTVFVPGEEDGQIYPRHALIVFEWDTAPALVRGIMEWERIVDPLVKDLVAALGLSLLADERSATNTPGTEDAGYAGYEDPEIAERKWRLLELYKRGYPRTNAEKALSLSPSAVKRLSKDLGLDWRIPKAKRRTK